MMSMNEVSAVQAWLCLISFTIDIFINIFCKLKEIEKFGLQNIDDVALMNMIQKYIECN